MANLSITSKCNLTCRYCFARESFAQSGREPANMSLSTFSRCLNFLVRSNIHQARLLGGEPTLHPEFQKLVAEILTKDMSLLIFSNGLMPESALCCLEDIPVNLVRVLINVVYLSHNQESVRDKQIESLRRLGSRAMLGINIDNPGVKFMPLLYLIQTYNLQPKIRLGLAHPTVSNQNKFIHTKHYQIVGKRILEFTERAESAGVQIEFDCGFVPCMFPIEALENLSKTLSNTGFCCNPILDILPDGQVISCYPLARVHKMGLPEKHDDKWLRAQFQSKLKLYRSTGLFKECPRCPLLKNNICAGGCIAAAIQRVRQCDFSLSIYN